MNNFVEVIWDDGFHRKFHFRDAGGALLFAGTLQQAKSTTIVLLKIAGQNWRKLK